MAKRAQGFENWDFSKMFGDFSVPNMPEMKFEGIAAAQQRNFEAFATANRMAVEGFQAIAQRNVEFFRDAYENGAQTAKSFAAPGSPGEGMSCQAELSSEAFQAGVANAREITGMVRQTVDQSVRVIADRMTESLSEMAGFATAEEAPMATKAAK
jgi:phasin family protein